MVSKGMLTLFKVLTAAYLKAGLGELQKSWRTKTTTTTKLLKHVHFIIHIAENRMHNELYSLTESKIHKKNVSKIEKHFFVQLLKTLN
jgi:hypothetical protein